MSTTTGDAPRPGDIERFNAKWIIDADGCHIWVGSRDWDGYGQFQFRGRPWKAHRWIFFWFHGFLPPVVMHHCDKPPCVRISCLIPGSVAENNADRNRKGRSADRRGALAGTAKLTASQVVEIREKYGTGMFSQRTLAAAYGVRQPQISCVINRKCWANV